MERSGIWTTGNTFPGRNAHCVAVRKRVTEGVPVVVYDAVSTPIKTTSDTESRFATAHFIPVPVYDAGVGTTEVRVNRNVSGLPAKGVVSLSAGRTVIPMKLLKELALGNIQPMVRNFKKDSVYTKLLAEVTERQEKLTETLSPEQKALFDAVSQAEIDLSVENDHDLFVKGFVLGAQIMLEILTADPMEGVVR